MHFWLPYPECLSALIIHPMSRPECLSVYWEHGFSCPGSQTRTNRKIGHQGTKTQRHKAKLFVIINLCVLVSWWRKCFCTKCKEFTAKGLNPDKPEITNYKHQITNKFQITISKSQIRSNVNCLWFWISVIVICLVFVICHLKFFNCWHLTLSVTYNMLSEKLR